MLQPEDVPASEGWEVLDPEDGEDSGLKEGSDPSEGGSARDWLREPPRLSEGPGPELLEGLAE